MKKQLNENEIIVVDKAKQIWKQIAKNSSDLEPNYEVEVYRKLLNIFQLGDYYHFIFNCANSKLEFVHENISKVLGYDTKGFTIEKLLSIIHSEDLPIFVNYENKVTEFFNQLPINQVLKYKVMYDYRIKKADGDYIRIMQQAIAIQSDEKGSVIRTLSVHTDISHIKKTNDSSLAFICIEDGPSYYNVEVTNVLEINKEIFTKREKEVLRLIVDGCSSIIMAETLFVSKHTIDTHRKNILKKANLNNVSSLIKKAIMEGWV